MKFGKYGHRPMATAIQLLRKRWDHIVPSHIDLYCLGGSPKVRFIACNHEERKFVPDTSR